MRIFNDETQGAEHIALVKGDIGVGNDPILVTDALIRSYVGYDRSGRSWQGL